jgi:hypothetical protein
VLVLLFIYLVNYRREKSGTEIVLSRHRHRHRHRHRQQGERWHRHAGAAQTLLLADYWVFEIKQIISRSARRGDVKYDGEPYAPVSLYAKKKKHTLLLLCAFGEAELWTWCGRAGQEGQPCPAAPLWSASATADPAQIIVTINAQKTRFNPFLVSAVPSCSLDRSVPRLARPVGHRQPPTNGTDRQPDQVSSAE